MRFKLLITLLMSFAVSACSTTSPSGQPQLDFISTLGISAGTVAFIEKSDDLSHRANRVIEVAEQIKQTASSSSPIVVSFLEAQARQLIDWNSLKLSEQILLNALLLSITQEIEQRISKGSLDENRLVILNDIFDIVIQSARPLSEG